MSRDRAYGKGVSIGEAKRQIGEYYLKVGGKEVVL